MSVSSVFVQVFIAIVLVIILLVIGFMTYNKEMVQALVASGKTKIVTPIFTGVKDLSIANGEVYNTLDGTDPTDPTYRNLGGAVNQTAGAEFTYNFWLYQDNTYLSQFSGDTSGSPTFGLRNDQLVLFMRGSDKVSKYNSLCGSSSTATSNIKTKTDVLVKCPLVKLENGGDVLTVEFNTVNSPDAVLENSRNICGEKSTDWDYINSYKIGLKNITKYNKQWIMVTIVVQDTYPTDPLPIRNKARCTIYINGGIELDQYVDGKFNPTTKDFSTVQQNQGNFYVAPQLGTGNNQTIKIPTGKTNLKQICLADLTYYNYVPSPDDIKNVYAAQFTKSYAPSFGNPITSKDSSTLNNFMNNVSGDSSNFKLSQIYSQ
jgi:hypothetical protein